MWPAADIDHIAGLLAPVAGGAAMDEARQILEASGDLETARARAGRRAAGAPLGLVLGRQAFLGVELLAREDVLAPREETELLGSEVLAILKRAASKDPRMIDMGCGCGNLACACAAALPALRVWASDITPSCSALARENAIQLGLGDRVTVAQGDLFAPLAGFGLAGSVDVVAMNPPYIPSSSLEKTHAGLLRHEPRAAFDGGPYGVSILTRLMREAPPFLKEGGSLLFEFGRGQGRMVSTLAERIPWYSGIRLLTDAQGEPRVGVLVRNGAPWAPDP
jgi:HemK-like putative methylase